MTAYIALLFTVALTVGGQVLQKQVADALTARQLLSNSSARLKFYLRHPRFWGALISLGCAMLVWLVVLKYMDVGRAYTLLSINYPIMLLVARFWFGEAIPLRRWLGVGAICTGLAVIFLN